ncbi:MAG TPA: ABC transporter ATP-binding protein [Ardenticatenaceae bacterium]|nr:ABC transporter ATP-binding protein [Ardenticatenaceae bacterium]
MENLQAQDIVIDTHGLSKRYGRVEALKALDLKVPKHSIFGFLGPNGAGKSTAIKLLLGLAKPTAGHGTIFGHDIVRESTEIRKRVGFLAQDPRYYDHMTARETLRFAASFFYHGPRDAVDARVAEMLALVGLEEKADRPIRGFSGGERQRLGIAQAQINYPDLLILDEPAAALDPMGRRDVLLVMERLRQHTTILYSTHILEDVQRVSDRVAIIAGGELVAQGPIEQLLSGTGSAVFTLVLKGETRASHGRVAALPWVSAIHVLSNNGKTTWQVSVSDEAAAEAQLLREVLREGDIIVTEYHRQKLNLEDVFVSLVEGGHHHGS